MPWNLLTYFKQTRISTFTGNMPGGWKVSLGVKNYHKWSKIKDRIKSYSMINVKILSKIIHIFVLHTLSIFYALSCIIYGTYQANIGCKCMNQLGSRVFHWCKKWDFRVLMPILLHLDHCWHQIKPWPPISLQIWISWVVWSSLQTCNQLLKF